ncbi:hypothetical protein KSS87_014475 [Heliosperma pusillum]|nr:hypothetical protein KSS87_005244 [Heliosperma pusillum]KAH9612236.1 hypothetical protein KSS87_010835 [Heliosperma pusillum]KAH9612447.1 hypothetical protein KSS87_014475 [Heliosperma pusillum]
MMMFCTALIRFVWFIMIIVTYECRMFYTILDRANASLDRDGLLIMLLDRTKVLLDRAVCF